VEASTQRRRQLWRGILIGAAVTLAFVAVVAIPLALAHRQDLPLERWYGNAAVSLISRIESLSVGSPPSSRARGSESGRLAFTGSCASCHGAKGDGRGVFGPTTYPPATDLTTSDAKEKSDAQLFAITKNGLGFTAMPAFGAQYSDQEIWGFVTYIRQLQSGGASPVNIEPPTSAQLALADPTGDQVHRGAAIYFAQGCQYCHGAVGGAPGELALRGRSEIEAVRSGRPGMPAYPATAITAAELADLRAYLATFAGGGR